MINVRSLIYKLQGRSWRWAGLRAEALAKQPYCTACLTRRSLTVHHILPVHLSRHLELEPTNLMVLCKRCHFFIAHFCNWRHFNREVLKDTQYWRSRVIGK